MLGYKTAILSGGFMFFGEHLQTRLGIDYVFANELEVENGTVTGKVAGDIVDGEQKEQILGANALTGKKSLDQVGAGGAGAEAPPPVKLARKGICLPSKPLDRQHSGHRRLLA